MLHGDSHSPAVCPLPAAVASGSSCVGNTPPVQDHLALDNSLTRSRRRSRIPSSLPCSKPLFRKQSPGRRRPRRPYFSSERPESEERARWPPQARRRRPGLGGQKRRHALHSPGRCLPDGRLDSADRTCRFHAWQRPRSSSRRLPKAPKTLPVEFPKARSPRHRPRRGGSRFSPDQSARNARGPLRGSSSLDGESKLGCDRRRRASWFEIAVPGGRRRTPRRRARRQQPRRQGPEISSSVSGVESPHSLFLTHLPTHRPLDTSPFSFPDGNASWALTTYAPGRSWHSHPAGDHSTRRHLSVCGRSRDRSIGAIP